MRNRQLHTLAKMIPDMVANVSAISATQTRTERLQMALPYRNEERSGLMLRSLIGIGTTLQKHSAHRMMSLHCSDVQGAGTATDGFRPICWRPIWNVVAKKLLDNVVETFPHCRSACATLYFVTIYQPEANLQVDFLHLSTQTPNSNVQTIPHFFESAGFVQT